MSGAVLSTWRVYRRVLGQAWPYRLHLLGLLLLSLASTPLALLTPLPLMIAIDSVLGPHPLPGFVEVVLPDAATRSDRGRLFVAVALVVVVALLSQLRVLVKGVLKTYTGQKLVLDFRGRLFHHAQRLSLSYHDARGTSDSTYRIQTDAAAVKTLAVNGVIPFVSSAVTLVTMVWVTAQIDPQLALVALVVVPLLFLTLRASVRHLRGGWHGVKRLDSSLMSVVQEVLGGVRVVKAFGQEDRERDRYAVHGQEKVRARTRLALQENSLGLVIGLIVAGGTAAVLYIGVTHVRSGVLTLGSLTLVMSYLAQLYRPLESISQRIGDVQSSLVSAERAFDLLDERPDVPERPDARSLRRASGRVAFDSVSFSYDGDHPVLEDVGFEVAPGTRLGIAGTTGAGKTTMVNLLTRFYDPTDGRILLDGVDLRDYRLADLRDQFAIVLQEPVLFSTSIAENIAYARPRASYDEVVDAARAAGAHEFVLALPDGYDTPVGERGLRLSGGERQRISLARAFLKDAPILILDEPTSSIDTRTESVIMGAMDDLMRGRTTFMIAHRLSTLEHCDLRLEIERGRLVNVSPERLDIDAAEVLRKAFAERDDGPAPIASLRSQPMGTFSRHPISRLEVTLVDGGRLDVVFKRLEPRPGRDARREVLLYRRLLAGGRFGAPRLHASVCDDADDRYWLFLEDLGPKRLDRCGIGDWDAAFRWMALLHATYLEREGELAALGCLDSHDATFYRSLVEQARAGLIWFGEPASLARFDALADGMESTVAYLCDQPLTLVHGAMHGQNVIVQDGVIRPVDWESAAVGVGAWDVATLAEGWRHRHRERLVGSYLDELATHVRGLDRGEFGRALAHCEVLRVLRRLHWWKEPCRRPGFVDELLDRMEQTWLRLDRQATGG